jgi:2-amino-4-hydroxy-6-hydroxymethyldihydropteridine diphosphokinase
VATVYLGLGSNLGNRRVNINSAIEHLKQNCITILARSSIIETDPVGGVPQGPFLNGVIKIDTQLEPEMLLSVIKTIEQRMGRINDVRNGPRLIDIDILLYDDVIIKSQHLTIPHPRMFERAFVMDPLNEIAPHINKSAYYASH